MLNESTELNCGRCGENYLHQTTVEVFNREEDKLNGLHAIVEWEQVKINNDITNNPSVRRHGLSIHFWCEFCGNGLRFDIYQHKGITYTEWVEVHPNTMSLSD